MVIISCCFVFQWRVPWLVWESVCRIASHWHWKRLVDDAYHTPAGNCDLFQLLAAVIFLFGWTAAAVRHARYRREMPGVHCVPAASPRCCYPRSQNRVRGDDPSSFAGPVAMDRLSAHACNCTGDMQLVCCCCCWWWWWWWWCWCWCCRR